MICALAMLTAFTLQTNAAGNRSTRSEETPIITIKTDAYTEVGPSNSFGLVLGATETEYYDIDTGFGLQEVEVEPWKFENGAITGTYKTVTVSEEGLIRVYGDPSKIDFIQLEGGYVTEIDMEQCLNLEVLNLSHNTLKKLDLTPFTNLYAIYLSDNPFTKESPLKVGGPKNRLAILEIDIIDHLDQSFDLKDYPALQVFDGYHNRDLWYLDPTGCPELLTISVELSNVSKLDLSKNPKLRSLNISESRVTELDLSNNPLISTLMAENVSGFINQGYYLKDIDLTCLPNLQILYIGGNRLKNLDLSKNTELFTLNARRNELTSLDLSNNPNLYSVTINHNNMDFASLPAPADTWGEYFYLQNDIRVPKSMSFTDTLDLSGQVLRPHTITTARVWQKMIDGNDTIINPALYKYQNGKLSFTQALTDSVYVRYSNSLLSDYDIFTTPFMVKAPEDMHKTITAIQMIPDADITGFNFGIGIHGATEENPVRFMVDFGDGARNEFTATSHKLIDLGISGNVKKDTQLTIYVPDGETISAFGMEGHPLNSIDLRNAHSLQTLVIKDAQLKTIDLRYNRCLETLILDGNLLEELDLTGLYPNWDKHVLYNLSASRNTLKTVTVASPQQIQKIDLSCNNLSDFSLKDYDKLSSLDLSDNAFEGELSLTYLNAADSINLSGNRINRIIYDNFTDLKLLDISHNLFNMQTMPYQPGADEFVYAPQKPMEVMRNAPSINLSDQDIIIVGNTGTTFTWKKEDGSLLTEGTEVNCEGGVTRFLKTDLGKVYCEMTNPAFPDFRDSLALRTTLINVTGAPTVVVATFTTLEDSETGELTIASPKGTTIYVDWRGDGSEFVPYEAIKDHNYDVYDGIRTYKGAEVKVYTFDELTDLSVFSVDGMKLANFDATPLTELIMLGIYYAGLDPDSIKLPDAPLTGLSLPGNKLTSFPWADKYPTLSSLNLTANRFESFDATSLKNLRTLYLAYNRLTDIKLDNPQIWELVLSNNLLESVDLSGLKRPEQIWLTANKLTEVNLLPFRASLRVLGLGQNRFTFQTLPSPTDFPNLSGYTYANQENVEAIITDDYMTYDLSSQAMIKGMYQTTYTWFLGEPIYDADNGSLSGDILYVDEEYTINDGVTTFQKRFSDDVVCVMTNDLFPRGYLRTPAYRIGSAPDAVETIATEEAPVDVYTLSGSVVKRQVSRAAALEGLSKGIYIVGGKKVFIN